MRFQIALEISTEIEQSKEKEKRIVNQQLRAQFINTCGKIFHKGGNINNIGISINTENNYYKVQTAF